MITGWYYLHENGEMIYKCDMLGIEADLRESDFVRMFWPVDASDRANAWTILVEGLAAGAKLERIKEIAGKWGCNNNDAIHYAVRIGVILQLDGNAWCATRKDFANLQESPAGFGDTCLDALAELCKKLGWKPRKMWGASFVDLVA